MIKNFFKASVALIALVSVTATGCSSVNTQKSDESKVQQENTTQSLQGAWLITEANDVETAKYEDEASVTFTADGKANGRAVVNGFFGDYALDGTSIQFDHIGATKMMGPEEEMQAESAILQAINDAKSVSVDGDKATVYDNKGKVVMTLKRK